MKGRISGNETIISRSVTFRVSCHMEYCKYCNSSLKWIFAVKHDWIFTPKSSITKPLVGER